MPEWEPSTWGVTRLVTTRQWVDVSRDRFTGAATLTIREQGKPTTQLSLDKAAAERLGKRLLGEIAD
jgi:hypothetical protein